MRLRFTLMRLFVVVSTIAVVLGFVARLYHIQSTELASRSVVEGLGGKVVVAPGRLRWLHGFVDERWCEHVVAIDLAGRQPLEADLQRLSGLSQAERIDLSGCAPTPAGIDALAGLPRLRHFRMCNADIGDAELEALSRLEWLESLEVGCEVGLPYTLMTDYTPHFTDAGMRFLRRLTRLRRLGVHGVPLSDDALTALTTMCELEWLDLAGAEITDQGAAALAHFPKLKALSVSYTAVGNAGLHYISQASALEHLHLQATKITDLSVEELAKLSRLVELDISYCGLSDRGLTQLVPHLEDLEVLDVTGTGAGDDAVRVICDRPRLHTLMIGSTKATDACAPYLKRCHALRMVVLKQGQLRNDTVERLAAELPGVTFKTQGFILMGL